MPEQPHCKRPLFFGMSRARSLSLDRGYVGALLAGAVGCVMPPGYPKWCVVYDRLGDQEMTEVARAEIENLPAQITGETVLVCGRAFYGTVAETPPKRLSRQARSWPLGNGRFAYYQLAPYRKVGA